MTSLRRWGYHTRRSVELDDGSINITYPTCPFLLPEELLAFRTSLSISVAMRSSRPYPKAFPFIERAFLSKKCKRGVKEDDRGQIKQGRFNERSCEESWEEVRWMGVRAQHNPEFP
jgi:hypothetical protein